MEETQAEQTEGPDLTEEDAFHIKVVTPGDGKARSFEKTITMSYTSPVDSKNFSGTLTFKKLTLGGHAKVARIRATLNGGFQPEEIGWDVALQNQYIAHVAVWLEGAKDLPEWAKNLEALHDSAIVRRLYEEGDSFEATFR